MNVTGSENGKYHQCGEGKEIRLTGSGFIGGKCMGGGWEKSNKFKLFAAHANFDPSDLP
jgi:hypothetical protein